MDLENFIEELEEIVESATKVPLSTKCMVDREEVWDVIQQFRLNYPNEIKEAQWVKKERERILNEAHQEADSIKEKARQEVTEMVNETEIIKIAQAKARDIIKEAEVTGVDIQNTATDNAKKITEDAEMRAADYKRRAIEYFDELLVRAEKVTENARDLVYTSYVQMNNAYTEMNNAYRETDSLLEQITSSRNAISSTNE